MSMPGPRRRPLLPGAPHRTLRLIQALVYEYDSLGVDTHLLPVAAIFQPWEPLTQWHGKHIPVTIGGSTKRFDWGEHAKTAYFLRDDDFFERCAPVDDSQAKAQPRIHEATLACPFSALPGIAVRLRLAAGSHGHQVCDRMDELLVCIEAVHARHTSAAESQRAAEGFDNTAAAAEYAAEQAGLLKQAREMLVTAKALLR